MATKRHRHPQPLLKQFTFLVEVKITARNYEKALQRFNRLALNKHDKTYNSYVTIVDTIQEDVFGKKATAEAL